MNEFAFIRDPMTNKNVSIHEMRGKQVLNNYLRYLQHIRRGGKNLKKTGGCGSCGAVPQTVVDPKCPGEPNMSGYAAPCGQLPLDKEWMASWKQGGRKSQRKMKNKKIKSRKFSN